jgi:nicotinate phosphoribosyltransferase
MMAAYFREGKNPPSTFELFVRKLPRGRSFLVCAGLEEALQSLETLRFTEEEIRYLRSLPMFSHTGEDFFEALLQLRFSGEVWAIPEGEIAFAGEPLLRVSAPLLEAQWVETMLLAVINMSTMVASKAARMVEAAQGRPVIELGTRRAHGPQAGMLAARAAFVGGCQGTSNVEAGRRFGIPVVGTSAHSFIMSFPTEEEAFRAYTAAFPESATLLIDTYDTLEGARKAARATPHLRGVRLDSGDLAALSIEVRKILDQEGHPNAKIVASNDLNEEKIAALLEAGAPIDIFGVGTELATVKDAPALGGVYKLIEQEDDHGRPLYPLKNSPDKPSYPGAKQIYRCLDEERRASHDVIALAEEAPPHHAIPLLECVMRDGKRLRPAPTMTQLQARFLEARKAFSPSLFALNAKASYPVEISPALEALHQEALAKLPTQSK